MHYNTHIHCIQLHIHTHTAFMTAEYSQTGPACHYPSSWPTLTICCALFHVHGWLKLRDKSWVIVLSLGSNACSWPRFSVLVLAGNEGWGCNGKRLNPLILMVRLLALLFQIPSWRESCDSPGATMHLIPVCHSLATGLALHITGVQFRGTIENYPVTGPPSPSPASWLMVFLRIFNEAMLQRENRY